MPSTSWGCGWGKLSVLYRSACTAHPQPVLHTVSLYIGCASARTAHHQPVRLVCVSPYCTPSACTSGVPQPVLHTLSLYVGCALASIAHHQPLLHILYTRYQWIQGDSASRKKCFLHAIYWALSKRRVFIYLTHTPAVRQFLVKPCMRDEVFTFVWKQLKIKAFFEFALVHASGCQGYALQPTATLLCRLLIYLRFLPLVTESGTSEWLCQIKGRFRGYPLCFKGHCLNKSQIHTTGLHQILHRGYKLPFDYFGTFNT